MELAWTRTLDLGGSEVDVRLGLNSASESNGGQCEDRGQATEVIYSSLTR